MFKKLFEKITGIEEQKAIIEIQQGLLNQRDQNYNSLFKYNTYLHSLHRENDTLKANLERARQQALDSDKHLKEIEKKYEQLIDEKEEALKLLRKQLNGEQHTGKFYVFNPKADKPRKIYNNYDSALNDAKSVSNISNGDEVFVLKIITGVQKSETINDYTDNIPY